VIRWQDQFKDSAERFARDTTNHEMTILRDDGLYRHLRFKPPTSGFYWFDIVTWPGFLAFVWSDTSHVFARVEDMFTFFRRPDYGINPGYWAEKLVTDRNVAEEFSETRFRRLVEEHVSDWIDNYDGDDPKFAETLRHEIKEFGLHDVFDESEARHALDRFEFVPDDGQKRIDAAEMAWSKAIRSGAADSDAAWKAYQRTQNDETYRFDGSGDWDLRDWQWSYLWACHAIVWGIDQYDQAKKSAVGGEPKATSKEASDLGSVALAVLREDGEQR
jgi:hypothetical protein